MTTRAPAPRGARAGRDRRRPALAAGLARTPSPDGPAPAGAGHVGKVGRPEAEVRFAAGLRLFLAPRLRGGRVRVACDGTSTLGHVVESLGVPLPEVGDLAINGRPTAPSFRLGGGEVADVGVVRRPQPLPSPRFLLDVHLGTLACRLRLLGVDAAYGNDLDNDTLIARANAGRPVLLTQDRGLLRRRKLWQGAYVRGARPDEQLADVLDRFAPPLAPWTAAPRVTGSCHRSARPTLSSCCRPARGARTTASRAVPPAVASTGVAPTASGSSLQSNQRSALPQPLTPAGGS
jgi:uncharacterized protein